MARRITPKPKVIMATKFPHTTLRTTVTESVASVPVIKNQDITMTTGPRKKEPSVAFNSTIRAPKEPFLILIEIKLVY
ncbi:hypothetical protein GWN63_01145 [Candidatus Bathyarchaeota archaeon]|nr:hypothetical protein [Candidatus Bathyarchaeota archaeon]